VEAVSVLLRAGAEIESRDKASPRLLNHVWVA
jgi:hypothetical protein